jgi:polyisoprenoid-binding protein YceI
MKFRLSMVLISALMFGPQYLHSQTIVLRLDPAHTQIVWTLSTVLHTVHGTFHLSSGSIEFQQKSGEASGLFTVDENTGESGDNTRDNRMKKSVLETAKDSVAAFRPTHVSGTYNPDGSSMLLIYGIFHLHGVDHPMKLPFQVTSHSNTVFATTKFDIPYIAWGLHDPSTLFLRVEKNVQMKIDATGTVQATP